MPKLPLTIVPNPLLRQVSKPVDSVDSPLIKLLDNMSTTLVKNEPPGVGLSGVQVGILKNLYVAQFPKDTHIPLKDWGKHRLHTRHFINPTITHTSKKSYLGDTKGDQHLEGCLSIPKVWGFVWRHYTIKLKFQELQRGQLVWREEVFEGFPARVLQHEQDHLSGILFTDHILGKSPIKGFKPLKPHHNPLLFETDDGFISIKNPTAFANW